MKWGNSSIINVHENTLAVANAHVHLLSLMLKIRERTIGENSKQQHFMLCVCCLISAAEPVLLHAVKNNNELISYAYTLTHTHIHTKIWHVFFTLLKDTLCWSRLLSLGWARCRVRPWKMRIYYCTYNWFHTENSGGKAAYVLLLFVRKGKSNTVPNNYSCCFLTTQCTPHQSAPASCSYTAN